MYCVKCGSEIPDNSEFCSVCGNRVSPERKKNGGLSVDNQTKQHKWIGIAVIVGMVLLVSVGIALFINRGRDYEKVVEKFMESIIKGDVSQIMEYVPDEVLNAVVVDAGGAGDVEAALENMEMSLASGFATLDQQYGKGWSCTYEIGDFEDFNRMELMELMNAYKEHGADIEISEAKRCIVDMTIEDKNGDEIRSTSTPISVIKSNGKWYLELANLGL